MAAAEGPIASKAKSMSPPDAVSCILVDHLNGRTLISVFEGLKKGQDDAMVEKVVHTISLHCRMHNQAVGEVLLPLVMKLSKGKELGKQLKAKLSEIERLLETLDDTKKHLDNEEFIKAMQKQKQADSEMMEMMEATILPALIDELGAEAEELVAAAEQMEAIKIKAPLMPQPKAFA
ncbi:hemerythrin [Chlorella sorokiniana]|uniref:Hemerythrin n=1 Tax=Chlorella sorokiniana TaxID=3076 RepID=A0A2P6TTY3_CHLSO|nr:hemerythrin [Chlorella sorokiniana]|eukprot:PRW57530.1 hemerythrin [Chlorella sorokiniana]